MVRSDKPCAPILPTPPEDVIGGIAVPRTLAPRADDPAAKQGHEAAIEGSLTGITFHRCRQDPGCSLADTIALLSPCVAQMPYLTENLLAEHGVSFTLDACLFKAPWLDPATRKIVLVEGHRHKATRELLLRLRTLYKQDSPLDASAGLEIDLFDWRLLECLRKVEQGRAMGLDPWQRCWVARV